ncbi:hypothetical protein F4861DRAFT_523269 [Xylaria intraflava]|nr:hypothetical protein F4861DRAFT_523269 [Xylaria intraflava]
MAATEPEPAWRRHLYLQTRLKEKNGRIRLLTIQSRQYAASRSESPPDTVHCFLRLAELKERPPFTAVSHRWQATDAADDTKSVLVNGASVPVSTGLFEVLRHIQREMEPVVVWIDALCINHADEDEREKSVQVSQLAQIFAVAEKTFIWLGPAADRSDEAMKVLRRLAEEQLTLSAYVAGWTPQLGLQLAQRILPSRFVPSGPATSSQEPLELQQELESLREPLKALMERAYWMDLWSLVELCLSQRGIVVCGHHGLTLDHFNSAARALDHIINHLTYSKWVAAATNPAAQDAVLSSEEVSNLSHSPALRILSRRYDYRNDATSWIKPPDNPLFTLLDRFYAAPIEPPLPLRITNPRDRVYAPACLATDIAELGVTVDYSKAVNQIYTEASAAFLKKHPRVLQLAQGTNPNNETIPSWTINWEQVTPPLSDQRPPDRPFNACGPADIRYHRAETSKAGQIALKAAIVSAVQEVGTTYHPDTNNPEDQTPNHPHLRTYLAEIGRFWEDSTASLSSPYFAEQATVALAKIPVADADDASPSATVEGYKATSEALFPTTASGHDDGNNNQPEAQHQPTESTPPAPTLDTRYIAAIAKTAGKKPFLSQSGHVGLGPADLSVGDVISIPYGSTVPLAFREAGDGAYRLVGEVYAFGIMHGEFMKVHRQETMLRII